MYLTGKKSNVMTEKPGVQIRRCPTWRIVHVQLSPLPLFSCNGHLACQWPQSILWRIQVDILCPLFSFVPSHSPSDAVTSTTIASDGPKDLLPVAVVFIGTHSLLCYPCRLSSQIALHFLVFLFPHGRYVEGSLFFHYHNNIMLFTVVPYRFFPRTFRTRFPTHYPYNWG